MTNYIELAQTWKHLQNLAPEAFLPITDEESLIKATATLKALDQEMGEDAEHPLRSLSDQLMGRIMAFEAEQFPIPPAAPDMELRLLLKEHNITQQQLAEATGIHQAQISKLASGKRAFTASHARKLAAYFGVSPAAFL